MSALQQAADTLESVPQELAQTAPQDGPAAGAPIPAAPGGGGGGGPLSPLVDVGGALSPGAGGGGVFADGLGPLGLSGASAAPRRALAPSDRHPSMRAAAQIASATALSVAAGAGGVARNVAPAALAAAAMGADGLTAGGGAGAAAGTYGLGSVLR